MKSEPKTRLSSVFSHLHALLAIIIISASVSCTDDCESDNTGSLIIENTNAEATLHVFVNRDIDAINAVGDLVIEPGEQQSTTLPAGDHILKALLRVTDCSGGRCSISNTSQPDRNTTLLACEDKNLVY